MKLIIAYIQPSRLRAVGAELLKADVGKISISDAKGCGQKKGYSDADHDAFSEVMLLPKIRLEIAVNDNFVKITVDAIVKGARTGRIGDGKIFIVPLEECIRIRSGDTGTNAIG